MPVGVNRISMDYSPKKRPQLGESRGLQVREEPSEQLGTPLLYTIKHGCPEGKRIMASDNFIMERLGHLLGNLRMAL